MEKSRKTKTKTISNGESESVQYYKTTISTQEDDLSDFQNPSLLRFSITPKDQPNRASTSHDFSPKDDGFLVSRPLTASSFFKPRKISFIEDYQKKDIPENEREGPKESMIEIPEIKINSSGRESINGQKIELSTKNSARARGSLSVSSPKPLLHIDISDSYQMQRPQTGVPNSKLSSSTRMKLREDKATTNFMRKSISKVAINQKLLNRMAHMRLEGESAYQFGLRRKASSPNQPGSPKGKQTKKLTKDGQLLKMLISPKNEELMSPAIIEARSPTRKAIIRDSQEIESPMLRLSYLKQKEISLGLNHNVYEGQKNPIEQISGTKTTPLKKMGLNAYSSLLLNPLVGEFKNLEKAKKPETEFMETPVEIFLRKADYFVQALLPIQIFLESGIKKDLTFIAETFLDDLYAEGMRTRIHEIQLVILYALAKAHFKMKNYSKAIFIFRQCKKLSVAYKCLVITLRAAKQVGKIFQELGNHAIALMYYNKALQIAWYINDVRGELKLYDLIGIQYYYLQNISKAIFFHNKMTMGHFEQDDSSVRLLAITKVKAILIENELNKRIFKREKKVEIFQNDPVMISSGEEEIEFPLLANDKQFLERKRLEDSMKSNMRHSLIQKKNVAKEFKLNPNKSKALYQSLIKEANHQIRYSTNLKIKYDIHPKNPSDVVIPPTTFTQFDSCVQKIRVSHMAPFRKIKFLESMESLGKNSDKFFKEKTQEVDKKEDEIDRGIVRKLIEKLHGAVVFTLVKVASLQRMHSGQKGSRKRKVGLFIG